MKTVPRQTHSSTINKISGIIPGAVNGLIWVTIVAALLLSVPFSPRLSAAAKTSTFADPLASQVEWVNEKISPVFDEAINQTLNKLTVEPTSEKSVKLPFTEADPQVRDDLEERMLVLVNNERKKRGIKPLRFDPELRKVARANSADMFARGYFSHVNPDGRNPFDRMKKARVKFLTAGENLALGPTLSICHTGLMNSPGHRANILNPAFGRIGIGILDGGVNGLMITQNFRN